MKERPILFSAPMVRAVLSGEKTQTRRAVKGMALDWLDNAKFTPEYVASPDNYMCPYGLPGDRLWVRETWMPDPSCDDDAWDNSAISYHEWDGCGMPMRDYPEALKSASNVIYRASWDGQEMVGWKPSIHMPRWASRITLEIISARLERLNEISEADAVAEGVEPNCALYDHSNCQHDEYMKYPQLEDDFPAFSATESFQSLWKSINGAGSWEQNPWVWVIKFKRVHEKLGESCES